MSEEMESVTGTEFEVCNDIARRQQLGIAKYGQTVRNNPLSHREWLQHAYEECLDQAVYLKRAIEELDDPAHLKPTPEILTPAAVGAPFDEPLNDDLDRLT